VKPAACPNCARLQGEIASLQKQVEGLKTLLEQARRAGKRQAAPFSKGPPAAAPKRPGRRPGEAYGRKGHRACPDHVDEVVEVPLPPACPDCEGPVEETHVEVQFQSELPEVRPHVTQFNVACGTCRRCRRAVRGRHGRQSSDARGAAAVHLGPRALAVAADLHQGLGLSYGKVAAVFASLFHLPTTRGGLCQALGRVGDRLLPTYTALQMAVQQAPMVVPDETGWKVGGTLRWLWVFVTAEMTVYAIFDGRGFEEAASILGEDFSGELTRDGWAPYRKFKKADHQTCFGHLLRRCHENLETAQRGTARVPHAVQRILKASLALRDRRDQGLLSPHGVAVARGRLEAAMDRLLEWRPKDDENRKLLQHLRVERDALFTFLRREGVDATNWRAENAIRPAVVARKVWGGNRTWNGADTHGAILSFLRTARQQGLDPCTLLVPVLCARAPEVAALRGIGPATPRAA
jgi:transposase